MMQPNTPSETGFEIVQIGSKSFEAAYELIQRFFREEGFRETGKMRNALEMMITGPGSAVFLANQAGRALGVATVTTSVGLEYGRSAEMEDLYVLPEERGKGIASALIEAACAWCAEQNCSVLLVTVTPEGESAYGLTNFYKKRLFYDYGRIILERTLERDNSAR